MVIFSYTGPPQVKILQKVLGGLLFLKLETVNNSIQQHCAGSLCSCVYCTWLMLNTVSSQVTHVHDATTGPCHSSVYRPQYGQC